MRSTMLVRFAVIIFSILGLSLEAPTAKLQTEHTLAGEWLVTSSPINGQTASPKGISLGFPDRDMVFEQQGDIRIGVVLREDVGHNVRPLGVWRVNGDQFSTTFQLWCPNEDGPCGSIVMRGRFVREDRISGTMTAFFDVFDDSTPTGYDSWTFSFVGNRTAAAASGGSN
jgi:hypothetical protein